MASIEKEPFGYIYVSGESVAKGQADIHKVIELLQGAERSLKYFINQDNPDLARKKYSLEVRVEPGSLVVLVTGIVIGSVVVPYIKTAVTEIAKNDTKDKTTADVVKLAVYNMKKTAQIAKHLGGMGIRTIKNARVKSRDHIELLNDKGEQLVVSKDELDMYAKAPKDLYKKVVTLVDKDSSVKIGSGSLGVDNDDLDIPFSKKNIFSPEVEDVFDVTLPELQDGMFVTLEGELTRGNGRTNTLGFEYKDHILTSVLKNSTVKDNKDLLFGRVRLQALISRKAKKLDAEDDLRRPKLIITDIEQIPSDDQQVNQQGLL